MRLTLLSTLIALTLTACGGGGSGSGGTTTVTPTTPVTTPTTPVVTTPTNPTTGIKGTYTADTQISNFARTPDLSNFKITDEMKKVVEETNKLRAEKGLAPLTIDENLSRYATIRAQEIGSQWSHRRPNPDGSNGAQFGNFSFSGYGAISTGENIAKGQANAGAVVGSWHDSPEHYANMINSVFTKIGVGYVYNESSPSKHQWVQIFGTDNVYAPEAQSALTLTKGEVGGLIANEVKFSDGKITIVEKRAAVYDGLNGKSGIYAKPHVIDYDKNQRIILRPNTDAGWQYQTIGELQHNARPVAYVNVGSKFTPANDAVIKAQYVGKSVGDLGKHSRVIADVVANVDFSSSSKTMQLNLSNSQSGTYDVLATDKTLAANGAAFDFSDTLKWNSSTAQFESSTGQASFYGTAAQEIGGQFARDIDYIPKNSTKSITETYRGAYGAVQK